MLKKYRAYNGACLKRSPSRGRVPETLLGTRASTGSWFFGASPSQARHRSLDPALAGSNPAAPASSKRWWNCGGPGDRVLRGGGKERGGGNDYPIVEEERRSIRAQPPVARRVAAIWGHLRRWPSWTMARASAASGRLASGPNSTPPGPPHFHHRLLVVEASTAPTSRIAYSSVGARLDDQYRPQDKDLRWQRVP